MSARLWLGLSVVANLALAWALAAHFHAKPAPAPVPRTVPKIAPVPPPPEAAPAVAPAAPETISFQWSELVSDDFKIYRDNLRGIGCPELTVRDIIMAEIDARYLGRRQAIVAEMQGRFWGMAAQSVNRPMEFLDGDWQKPLKDLNDEREKLIAEVLGDDSETDPAAARTQRENWAEQRYSWLPEAKRRQLVALGEKLAEQNRALRDEVNKRKWTAADNARQQSFAAEFDAARKQLLTPEELAELNLRMSSAANWAQNLPGFEATESEWRTVAKAQFDLAAATSAAGKTNLTPGERQLQQKQMQAELQKSIQATLGPDRFSQYQQAQDGSYQQVRRVTQRYGLADTVAQQARDMQRVAEAQARQVRENADLAPDARSAALAAIRQETERSLSATLGPKVFGTYQRYGGDWVSQLAPSPAE